MFNYSGKPSGFGNITDFMMQIMSGGESAMPQTPAMPSPQPNPYTASIAPQIQAMYPGVQAPVAAPAPVQPAPQQPAMPGQDFFSMLMAMLMGQNRQPYNAWDQRQGSKGDGGMPDGIRGSGISSQTGDRYGITGDPRDRIR